jgi:type III secretion protein V
MENTLASLQRFVAVAARRADLVLAVILMAVVFMLVLPLPTVLVDVLVAINIAVSALLLMVAMYLPSPLAFTSFPSVLLVTTLFRLALSIATTRLILIQADAGHIIEAFGNFVVGGNLVVGLVVFLILTIVQFIVITKGAERVAEVAARFSLDAMPGKQMSIDADMRAGAIDMNEARRRRTRLEKESQLYGAMDGAVKFVKGDAIASIIIVFVNLGGGMLIGTMQRGLPASEAMAIYSVLTIGDGLIAQIPALLMSITAGMIVTRVTSEDGGRSNVGRDIAEQVLAQPNALLVSGAIMLGFALVPGMPGWVFMVLAVLAGVVGFVLLGRGLKGAAAPGDRTAGPAARAGATRGQTDEDVDGDGKSAASYAPTMPLVLDLAHDLEGSLNARHLIAALQAVREETYMELGVPLPAVHLRYNKGLVKGSYQILVHEISSARGLLQPGYLLVREAPENLEALGIPFNEAAAFLPNIATLWTPEHEAARLREYGIQAMDTMQVLASQLRITLKRHAREFIGIQEVQFLLSQMQADYPDLITELHRVVPAQRVADVLQRLVSEGVSVRNLRTIAEALVDWGGKERDVVLLAEHVRTALKRQISHQFADRQQMLAAYLLSLEFEDVIRNGIRQTSMGSYLALDAEQTSDLLDRITETVGDLSAISHKPVILTSMDIRRYVRKMIEESLYEVAVLSYQELVPEINVQPLARIELGP